LSEKKPLKHVELKLISELMKNSRRSDRELARAIGVSQPTVGRLMKKIEKQGIIREYTAIPDFSKLGYEMLALNFVRLKTGLSDEEVEAARKGAKERVQQSSFGIVMLERGIGLGFDGVIVSLYKDYSDYAKHGIAIQDFPFIEGSRSEAFLINLNDEVRYRPLSFQAIAKQLATREKKEGVKP
jgi:DNA-binding Lrp family transcriptional regulator